MKTKSGRSMNPTDAYRKEERRKQANRNKLERKYQRDFHRRINNADSLKDELKSIIVAEENGTINKTMRLKKKVLQDTYNHAIRKQKETEIKVAQEEEEVMEEEPPVTLLSKLPVPPPPPLPPGPKPIGLNNILPPPPGPPPGYFMPFQPAMYNTSSFQPGRHARAVRKSTEEIVRDHKPTITAAPTVVKKPLAQDDKSITSMVPASVRVKRSAESTKSKSSSVRKPDLAPGSKPPTSAEKTEDKSQVALEQKMNAFLSEVQELGAFDD